MEHYNLRDDEVVLYKGQIILLNNNKKTELIFTNLNLVFITKSKKIFQEEVVDVEIFSINDIKIYEGIPQVKTKSNNVELYFKSTEKQFNFESKSELHKFVSSLNILLTGKTSAERNAEKVKNTIGLINDTLGIDIVKSTGEIAKNGVVGSITGVIGKFAKSLFNKKKK